MKMPAKKKKSSTTKPKAVDTPTADARCVCGDVQIKIDFPAFWAWHDHSAATRHAHGAAYATYVGTRKSRVRVVSGAESVTTFEDATSGTSRSFCRRCGTPVFYTRPHAPTWINIPRALFHTRTGREPRYDLGLAEVAEWEYRGEPLSPLKGYPGVMRERVRKKMGALFDPTGEPL
jgi:hypothetical protein